MAKYNITSNWVPDIRQFKKFVEIAEGIDVKTLKRLHDQIEDARGTPQEPRDWRNPSSWIPKLHRDKTLDSETRKVAEKISQAELNPRHANYSYARRSVRHGLLKDKLGAYVITEKGRKFIEGDREVVDHYLSENGIFKVLEFLNEETGATKEELVEKWREFINTEGGRNVKARSVLLEGVLSRIDNVLIPLGYIRKEGHPRRYFITEEGVKKIEERQIESAGRGKEEKTKHAIAIDNILDIGKKLGYRIQPHPKLRDLLPKEKQRETGVWVYNKELDGLWKTNLPLVGEIQIPIEIQSQGSITDLLSRLKIIAPYSHFMIIVSDEKQIGDINEYIKAQGEEKIFSDRTVYLTFEDLTKIRSQVSNISSKLKPSYVEEISELERREG